VTETLGVSKMWCSMQLKLAAFILFVQQIYWPCYGLLSLSSRLFVSHLPQERNPITHDGLRRRNPCFQNLGGQRQISLQSFVFLGPRLSWSPSLFLSSASAPARISSNKDLIPGIEAVDAANEVLLSRLEDIRKKPHFSLYSIDILASCEYMPQELFECYSETCEIYPVDEDQVSGRDNDHRQLLQVTGNIDLFCVILCATLLNLLFIFGFLPHALVFLLDSFSAIDSTTANGYGHGRKYF
jgi:hypothetical protein